MYLIGDIQGCDDALQQLLDLVAFSPSRDTLWALGDLVNRGPGSAAVLRSMMGYGASARCLLGNHDLHLLAIAHGVRKLHRGDTVGDVLNDPQCDAMLYWLRHQNMALRQAVGTTDLLMVHAGVLPSWSADQTMELAQEVQTRLQSADYGDFLHEMYGNAPTAWDDSLLASQRLRVIVNALTRLRFCTPQGAMEFHHSGPAESAPPGYLPWFDVPGRQTTGQVVAFGHWSTLGWLDRADVLAMDSGCVWGGALSALRVAAGGHEAKWQTELIQLPCQACQQPDSAPIPS
jgi:bis(5'-nucleosyl)-tetraphosphatase (symmetrical)